MTTRKQLESYQVAFDNFRKDTEAVESAILKSTEAKFDGSGYSLELFEDGTYRVLWDNSIGNLYKSQGIIISIPQLDWEDYEDHDNRYFDNAIDDLDSVWENTIDNAWEDYLNELRDKWLLKEED